MTNALVMLALMTGPWLATRVVAALRGRALDARGAAAAVGLALLFAFTALGHFVMTEEMARMLPPSVPARTLQVHVTGVLEFAVAAGFLIPATRRSTGLAAIVLLVLFLPVNVHAAIERIPVGGHAWGPLYLLVRVPLQAAIVLWTWWFTVRIPKESARCQDRARD